MNDLSLPAYTPVYPVTKTVKPRQRATTMPEWGIEQRMTRGQNQTSPEWKLKWILRPIEANTLDVFFAERSKGGEWFRWTPPTGTGGRFRCDNWSKQVVACNIWEVEATIREVFSYDLPLLAPSIGGLSLSGPPPSFVYNKIFTADAGSLTLSGLPVGLFKTTPIYADKGVFQLTGTSITVAKSWCLDADVGAYVLMGNNVTLPFFSFAIASIVFSLTATPGEIDLGIFALSTPVTAASMQLSVIPVTFAVTTTPSAVTLSQVGLNSVTGSATSQLLVAPIDFF